MPIGTVPMRIPDIPVLRCEGCGGDRFIPLTFPARKGAEKAGASARPTAKCLTCGWSYTASRART
jgi:hypothetical protein